MGHKSPSTGIAHHFRSWKIPDVKPMKADIAAGMLLVEGIAEVNFERSDFLRA
jgi:hypothetical protein